MREGVTGTEAFMVLYGGANTSFTTCVGILQRLVWHHDHHNGQPIESALHQYLIWVDPFMKIIDKRTIEMTEAGAYWLLSKKRPSVVRPPKVVEDQGFESWFSVYPRKVGKQAAYKSWVACKSIRPSDDQMMASLNRHMQSEQWKKDEGKWIPMPSTYLNQGRWTDELKMNNGSTIRVIRPDDKL